MGFPCACSWMILEPRWELNAQDGIQSSQDLLGVGTSARTGCPTHCVRLDPFPGKQRSSFRRLYFGVFLRKPRSLAGAFGDVCGAGLFPTIAPGEQGSLHMAESKYGATTSWLLARIWRAEFVSRGWVRLSSGASLEKLNP